MKKVRIKNINFNDIKHFVELAENVEEPGVAVRKGKITIDGSSLMGMLALDTSDGIEVSYPASATEFDLFIQTLI